MAKKFKKPNRCNIAGRLHTFFSEAKSTGGSAAGNVWAYLLGISGADPKQSNVKLSPDAYARLHSELGLVLEELTQLESMLADTKKENAPVFTRGFDGLKLALVLRDVKRDWSTVQGEITEAGLHSLEVASVELETEVPATDDELESIYQSLQELTQTVRSMSIDETLKQVLLSSIADAKKCIDEYWIRGAPQFRRSLAILLGNTALVRNYMLETTEESSTFFSKLTSTLNKLANLAEKCDKAKPLIGVTVRAIAWLNSDSKSQ